MKKQDLKTGMRVKLRDGNTGIVLLNLTGNEYEKNIIVIEYGMHRNLDNYNDNLCYDNNGNRLLYCDIIKVYDIPNNIWEIINFDIKGKLLWERKEEIKEFTLKEIADKLGVDVKVLRIKDN